MPAAKRHQTLTLKPDGTAELDTQVLKAGSTTPESSDTSTGAFTVVSREVVVTFTTKDGKPLPPADTMRVLKMTRGTGNKTLVGDDGRTFERAK